MREIKVGLIGIGTVGTGTAKVLIENRRLLEKRCGFTIKLTSACDLDIKKNRGIDLSSCKLTTSVDEILDDENIDIVVELIGGIELARKVITKAIEKGKHVVTANKALLSQHGDEFLKLADKNGVNVGFEASVGGGIPVIRSIKEGLVANNFNYLYGIINGTANYILTEMSLGKGDFNSVLNDAQRLGYAEADPSYDIHGDDTSHKLAILSTLAFGKVIKPSKIYTSGITELSPVDLKYAAEFGYSVKLLAILKRLEHEIDVRVHPTMIPVKHMLSSVSGVYNAIIINGDFIGTTLLYGEGAGERATASAVVSDVVDISRDIVNCKSKRMPSMNYVAGAGENELTIKNIDDLACEYYLRFKVADHPGVLAGISNIMANKNISIASVIQRPGDEGTATIVIMTHESREKDVQRALKRIGSLPDILEKTVLIRVENV